MICLNNQMSLNFTDILYCNLDIPIFFENDIDFSMGMCYHQIVFNAINRILQEVFMESKKTKMFLYNCNATIRAY